jgi:hypothetical protein
VSEWLLIVGSTFWSGFFAFWLMLWAVQARHRLQSRRACPYEVLRTLALAFGALVSVLMVVLLLQDKGDTVRVPLVSLWMGVLVGVAYFFVLPEAWWRARRSRWWRVE